MSPVPLICANWKMNLTPSESERFVADFKTRMAPIRDRLGRDVRVALAPAHPVIDRVAQGLAGTGIDWAGQNVHADESGAFTGEVSLAMLTDLGCRYALLGHSERRQLFGEQDNEIAAKALRLRGSSVCPILCVGETLDEREHEATLEVVGAQLAAVLDRWGEVDAGDSNSGSADLVVAYEPVWAIGTGRTATPEMAQEVHASIRQTLIDRLGEAGRETPLLYGGSVKPPNAKELLSQPDINGALVGGASLDPEAFASIVLASLETP